MHKSAAIPESAICSTARKNAIPNNVGGHFANLFALLIVELSLVAFVHLMFIYLFIFLVVYL